MGDSVFLAQYLRDRSVLQVRADAILVAAEANRTIVDAMVADDAAVADKVDLLRTGVNAIQVQLDAVLAAAEITRTQEDLLVRYLLNHVTGPAPGLAEGTNANTIQVATAFSFINQGIPRAVKAVTDNIAMTALALQADVKYVKYLCTITAGAAVVITKGVEDAVEANAVLPAVPANETPFGYFQVLTGGATFTCGTDDLGGGSFTVTFVDINWPQNGAHALAVLGATGASAIGDQSIGAALGAIEETALGATGLSAIGTMQPIPV